MNKKTVARVLIGFLAFVMIAVMVACCLTGCGNKQMFDTTYTYNYAIVQLPNGEVVEGKVDSWTDFEDGDQIQVKIGGKSYLVHSENIALIDE
jgi:hypothetical protein